MCASARPCLLPIFGGATDKPEGSSVEARADAAAHRVCTGSALGRLDGARVVDDGEEAYTTLEFLRAIAMKSRGTLLYTEEAWPTSVKARENVALR